MASHEVPRILLLQDYDDANRVIAGVLSLKGCNVYKSTTVEQCLSLMNEHGGNIDVVLIKEEIASGKDSKILQVIKKINPLVMTMVISNDSRVREAGPEIGDYQVDELVTTPISAENLADKILMLIAKKQLKSIKESQSRN